MNYFTYVLETKHTENLNTTNCSMRENVRGLTKLVLFAENACDDCYLPLYLSDTGCKSLSAFTILQILKEFEKVRVRKVEPF